MTSTLCIEEVEVVVNCVIVRSHSCPASKETYDHRYPSESQHSSVEVVDQVPLDDPVVKSSVAEVEVELLVAS